MNLRKKTLLMIGAAIATMLGVLYATSSTILLNGFTKLEAQEAQRNVQRVLDAFSTYLEDFATLNYQWGVWDETYNFIQNRNPAYIERNLRPAEFLTLRANMMLFINPQGELIFGRGFDLKQQKEIPLPADLQKHLQVNISQLKNTDGKTRFKGIVLLPEGPMAIAAGPILTSEGTGPSRGTLVFGRYLDTGEISHLAELTHLNLTPYIINDAQLPSDFAAVRQTFNTLTATKNSSTAISSRPAEIVVKPLSTDVMAGYTQLRDIYGDPALLLRVNMPREIYRQGQISVIYLMLAILGFGLIFGLATLWLLEKLLLYRLESLSNSVRHIGATNDLSVRVAIAGNDELTSLGNAINGMLTDLEESSALVTKEREKSEKLLLNILPASIATQLKQDQHTIANSFPECTVLFADIVGFTQLAASISPVDLVGLLNQIFSRFDTLAEHHGLEKIKTIGDAYMVVGGLPIPRAGHAAAVADMALDMQDAIARFNAENQQSFRIRIGINTGPVVAGVIGLKKFIYDLWGDTVNLASRMESHGIPDCIQVTPETYAVLKENFQFQDRGIVNIKGKGDINTYLLVGRKAAIPVASEY